MVQQKRRTRRNSTRRLQGLIAGLSVVLVAVIIVALLLPERAPGLVQDPQTDPPAIETGPRLEGWQLLGGYTYYYVDGAPVTGVFTVNEGIYIADEEGVCYTEGWVSWNGAQYLLDEDGKAVTGWQELEGYQYYFREDGTLATGTLQIDGRNYFFSSTGVFFHVVNPWNYVPDDYTPDLVALPEKYGDNQYIDSSCYDALLQMLDDCNAAMNGTTSVYVVSAYRTMERQTANYNNKVDRVMAANPSLTREQAEKEAATVVAVPGTSEHQLGLAADIIDTQLWALEEEQADLPAQKWLMENCWRYGFILRYPKDAIDSTGIIYEPWHYRYLGKALAEEIHHSGLTVEQYLDSLNS